MEGALNNLIPLRLNIRNFLSYRENVPTLDFTGIHVACLCGDNGHGKSALLDAITWCIWGRARGQVQDDLVSYGADDARVELDFLARDSCYRAVRSRRRAGNRRRQGASDLQLLAIAEGDGTGQVISGNSVRETQARIEQLVGMDYETFVNSAFLLQGRADEFTNRTPAERKAILSSILGLEAYDRFQTRARERANDSGRDVDRLAGGLSQIQTEIVSAGDPAAELEATKGQLAALERQLGEQRRATEQLRERASSLRRMETDIKQQRQHAHQLSREIGEIETGISSLAARIAQHNAVIDQRAKIERGVANLHDARVRFTNLEEARQRYDDLRQEHNRLTQAIAIEGAKLESEIKQLRQRIDEELIPATDAYPALVTSKEATLQALAELAPRENYLVSLRGRTQELAEAIGEAQSTAARYQSEGEQLNEKLHLLQVSNSDTAVCPLCLTPLSEDGCQTLAITYQMEIEEKRALYRTNRERLQLLETEKGDLDVELSHQEKELARRVNDLRDKLARLDAQMEASKAAKVEQERVNAYLGTLVTLVQADEFATEPRSQVSKVNKLLEELAYDEEAYRHTYQLVQELEPYTQLKLRLEQAQNQSPEDMAALERGQELLRSKRLELESIEAQIQTSQSAITELPGVESELDEKYSTVAELEGRQQSALTRIGFLEGQVNRLAGLRQELNRDSRRLTALQEQHGIYQELVGAFGRQGIQAMLIETVVPRLEEETNLLLGRMTDNRMHVKLETQRERRSGNGDPIETLEIYVSDELGQRSYEMYSGGEAFRVNLALRIALSRVLSQRTGAPLPTLFIDEGFGTQDASGRERILDVISSIEDDFDKIIVITHLDDLKDMFPVRIEVQKDANGSTFWLS